MKNNDVSFYNDDKTKRFNYRVALLPVCNSKILLQKSDKDDFYSLIGGRVHLFETSEEAIIRETKEETGINLTKNDINQIEKLYDS